MNKRKLIGYVGVDSGMIVFGDPVYIDKVTDAVDAVEDWNERAGKDLRVLPVIDVSTNVKKAIYGAAVNTGMGDGFYPVYVTTEDLGAWGKRVSKIEIEFL